MSTAWWWRTGAAAVLVACTMSVALGGAQPDALLRHVLLLPVVVVAIRDGGARGALAGLVAASLHAPFVLPHIEREGLTERAAEGLVTLVLLAASGVVTGALAGAVTRERRRYATLMKVQHAAGGDTGTIHAVAARLHAAHADAIGPADIGLVLDAGHERVTVGVVPFDRATIEAVMADRQPRFLYDAGGGTRARRALAVPVHGRARVAGVLCASRAGEIDTGDRATLEALGAYAGLALENAELAEAQRRAAAELEAKIAAATRHLRELDAAKSAFVAVASHELRTPLTALAGFSELLSIRRFAPESVQHFAGVMRTETARLVRMIDDLLDLARLEQGHELALRRTAVDPRMAIRDAVAVFLGEGAAAPTIDIDCEADVPAVHADPDALDRVLKNLVSNARKYAPGPLRIRVRRRGRAVEFAVEDQGPGIPPEALPHVFDPYYRAPATAGHVRGSGLGLAVVQALVHAHGGSIAVESATGAGTCVRVTIPSVS
jgi:signal transduction histidine kinase